ncbi:hypothetical protein [Alteribacillus bidgolensis]|uniref:Uncharacterized protein n=1 Tax=Alteribacillus bidgolensis TaxID=930129 RepID=A0A1G8CN35_9BACI|nr:hypothetical protein [Alteribacillus bidgolensis]SDH46699.1 hypothetical protein SAMN05216352_101379 [Alteribacillus bidgolensis]
MFLNIVAGFIIPLILSFFLYKKYPKVIIFLYPLGISIAFAANDWGYQYYWLVAPFHDNPSLAVLPFNFGYFPFICYLFSYFKVKQLMNSNLLLMVFAFVTTCIEYLGVLLDRIHYYGEWNIFFTFLTYLICFMITSFYVKILKIYQVL